MAFFILGKGKVKEPVKYLCAAMFCLFIATPQFAYSQERQVKKDSDGDGKIDRITCFDAFGKISRFEIDTNADGIMDSFQIYADEKLVRAERDLDFNGKTDCIDYFTEGKRNRQERLNGSGRISQITEFDENQQPSLVKKDTTGNGGFDTLYSFEKGSLILSTKDTDGNGKANVRQKYRDNKPTEQQTDDNEDGRPEREIFFDPGEPP